MANKCPICGRVLETFTNDPLLCNPSLSTDEYKGFNSITITQIKELQDERKSLEDDCLAEGDKTEFSSIDSSCPEKCVCFCKYILELRESTEKLLDNVGTSKHDYFSFDEDLDPLPLAKEDWTDPELEPDKFQIKAIHIEDLRRMIHPWWRETWDTVRIEPSDPNSAIADSRNDTADNMFNWPPYSLWSKTYDFPAKTLYADKTWNVGQSCHILDGSNYQHTKFDISTEWDAGTKVLNYSGNLDNYYSDYHWISYTDLYSNFNANANNYKCRNYLRLEFELSKSIDAFMGYKVILVPFWWDYMGQHYRDTNAELDAQIAHKSARYGGVDVGGIIEVRVYFNKYVPYGYSQRQFYLSFYEMNDQWESLPEYGGVLWTPDSRNGMYLYDAILDVGTRETIPSISPEDFATTWNITNVAVYSYGITTVATVFMTEGGYLDVKGYTTDAYLHLDYTIDNITLVKRVP